MVATHPTGWEDGQGHVVERTLGDKGWKQETRGTGGACTRSATSGALCTLGRGRDLWGAIELDCDCVAAMHGAAAEHCWRAPCTHLVAACAAARPAARGWQQRRGHGIHSRPAGGRQAISTSIAHTVASRKPSAALEPALANSTPLKGRSCLQWVSASSTNHLLLKVCLQAKG